MLPVLSKYICPKYWIIICLAVIYLLVSCRGLTEKKDKSLVVNNNEQPELKLHIHHLDDQLGENSGIILYRGYLWTINDSGGKPILYAVHLKTGKIIQSISIANAKNRDWEDIAQDSSHIYIGDFGDNNLKRKKLFIYIINKGDIPLHGNKILEAETIIFSYEGMSGSPMVKDRILTDCEAFFAWNDTLYFFSKDRYDQTTTFYSLPAKPGEYTIAPEQVYPSEGFITGADISKDGKFVVLSGYKEHVPFLLIFHDIQMPDIFSAKMNRLEFPYYSDLQTEGVAIQSPEIVFISSERTSFPPQVYSIDLTGIIGK
jgi:hypothetical protein